MKGVDLIGPMLEPTQGDATDAKSTKDAKQFDALLAEAVEQEAAPQAKDGKVRLPGVRGAQNDQGVRVEAPKVDAQQLKSVARAIELPATPRSIHSAVQMQPRFDGMQEVTQEDASIAIPVEGKLDKGASLEEPTVEPRLGKMGRAEELREPQSPEQMQAVLAQVATVVARIVAPQQAQVAPPKVETAQATSAAAASAQVATEAAAAPMVSPSQARAFSDALDAFGSLPAAHDDAAQHAAQSAVTLRPGADASADVVVSGLEGAPAEAAPRGAMGRVGQAASETPVRAAAGRVMNALRGQQPAEARAALTNNEAAATPRAPMMAMPSAAGPTVATAGDKSAGPSGPGFAVPADAPAPRAEDVRALRTVAQSLRGAAPQAGAARVMSNAPVEPTTLAQGPELPTVRPGAGPTAPPVATRAEAPAAPQQPQAATPQVAPNAQQTTALQPTGAAPVQPVVVQVQQAVEEEQAVATNAERAEPADGEPSGPRERVHGFSRGGWEQARSAYGGRGHDSGERSGREGGGERSEMARAVRREEERAGERVDEKVSAFMPEPMLPVPDPQLLQPQQQAPEVRPQEVARNQPAPAAPVQELPDIVFQGRPDPTAARENATISLHHPDLGPIQLEVHREQGRVEVHAVIENQHAQAVLRANEQGIRQGVQQSGMSFSALRVRMKGEDQPSNRPSQERRRRNQERGA